MTGHGAGGVQQALVTFAQALRHTHDVQTIVWKNSPIIAQLVAQGIDFQVLPLRAGRRIPNVFQAFLLRRLLQAFSPALVIGFSPRGYIEAKIASRNEEWVLAARIGTMASQKIARTLNADAWIANSREMGLLLQEVGCEADRIFVVENFLPSNKTHQVVERDDGRKRIGAAGRFVKRKGFDLILEAATILAAKNVDVEWRLAGDGPERARLEKLVAQAGLKDRIAFVGWLSAGEKNAFYEGLDFFVCPSIDDPFPRVMLEAAQAGVPVVATDFVGSRTVFTDRTNALIAKENTGASIAIAVSELISSPSLAQELSRNAAELFNSRYSLDAGEKRIHKAVALLARLKRR